MSKTRLEFKIQPINHEIMDAKKMETITLTADKNQFKILYNHHFTELINGDRLQIGNNLVHVSIIEEIKSAKHSEKKSSFEHSGHSSEIDKNDALAFLYQNQDSSLLKQDFVKESNILDERSIIQEQKTGFLKNFFSHKLKAKESS